jgi:hypothetical protein
MGDLEIVLCDGVGHSSEHRYLFDFADETHGRRCILATFIYRFSPVFVYYTPGCSPTLPAGIRWPGHPYSSFAPPTS